MSKGIFTPKETSDGNCLLSICFCLLRTEKGDCYRVNHTMKNTQGVARLTRTQVRVIVKFLGDP